MLRTPFIDRLEEEAEKLQQKKSRLQKFVNSDAFKDQEKSYRQLCQDQLIGMNMYYEALNKRIAYLKG